MFCLKNTKEGAALLLDFCAGKMERAQAAEIEQHLANCGACRELVEKQRSVWDALDQWTPPAVSPEFNARVYARVAQESSGWRKWLPGVFQPAVPYSIWKSAALVAACAVLVIGFTVRAPQTREAAPVVDSEKVDIEQVANTLEELDMLIPAAPQQPASAM
ncbi:MAG TPA: zf-HC2 domain-containing protein [Bryobacteraceae bacterium]|nr:zf-HC2 domain-containing protein [Bryobacteraceae bacterium]